MKTPWPQGRCVKCKAPMVRIDGNPFCSACERQMLGFVSEKVPKLKKKGPIELRIEGEQR